MASFLGFLAREVPVWSKARPNIKIDKRIVTLLLMIIRLRFASLRVPESYNTPVVMESISIC